MSEISINDVKIRNFSFEDIAPTVSYWTENDPAYWAARGVDLKKVKPKDEFTALYTEKLKSDGDIPSNCVITYKGKAIGMHSITHIVEKDHAIMHAHIWYPEYRGKGIGYFSYPLAMDFFMKKMGFKRIVFKTPKINIAANKIKEKLNIPCLGDTIFDASVFIKPLEANLYELDRAAIDFLLEKIQSTK